MTRLAILLRSALLILTLVCVSQTMARSQKYKVTIKAKEQRLLDVFKTIQKQTNLIVFYSNTILNDQEKVSIQVKDEALEKVLDQIVAGKALQYEVQEKYIVISPKEIKKQTTKEEGVVSAEDVPAPPPTIDVSGRVTDEEGNPLMGASIIIKGTKTGTQTNAEGFFILKGVDEKAVLEISYVGFEKRELTATRMQAIKTLSLKRTDSPLDEVQVIAYGETTKRLSAGNSFTVRAADIEKQPVQNPLLALQGRVPGLVITQTSGTANGHVKVRIQGQNSLRDDYKNEPLIVIDGIPYPTSLESDGSGSPLSVNDNTRGASPLNFVNPGDIATIDVLKDGDATAIYGSRGANGVILITTKKGSAGKISVNAKLQHGWGSVTRRLNVLNTRQYLDMRYEAIANDGLSITSAANVDLRLWDTTRNTDWQKTLIGNTAQYTTANASISGGMPSLRYLVSTTFSRVTDVLPGDMSNRSGSLHFNISSSTANQKFRLQLSGSYLTNENSLPGIDLTELAISLAPVAPPLYNTDGSLHWAPNSSGSSTWDNPLIFTALRNVRHNTQNMLSSVNLSYRILPGLELKTTAGFNRLAGSSFRGTPIEYFPPEDRLTSNRATFLSKTSNTTWIVEPQILYNRKLNNLTVDAIAGGTLQRSNRDYLRVSASGFSSDLLLESLGLGNTVSVGSDASSYRYAAIYGRINFNLSDKYILNFNGRRDGSSRFGSANKYHNFGSIGTAWLWSKERFISKNLSLLSHGKLRASFGTSGSDQVGDYRFLSAYGGVAAVIPYQGISALAPSLIPNPYLQWEEVRKWAFGLDLGFFSDRVLLYLNYSRNRSSNQLQSISLPTITGFSSISKNLPALIQNTSWEFTLQATPIRTKDVHWQSSVNLTLPKNKLLSFPNIELTTFAAGNNGVIVGQPLGVTKVYRYFGVDPATGLSMVYDAQGNPTSNPSSIDRTVLINTQPKFYGGINNAISYRGIELSFFIHFVRQLDIKDKYYNGRLSPPGRFGVSGSNQPISVLNRWQKPGDQTDISRFGTSISLSNIAPSSDAGYSYAASFVRLKNVAFAWSLPSSWITKYGLQQAKFSFQGQNLLTLTKFTGLDPESGAGSSLPPLQIWTISLQLGF